MTRNDYSLLRVARPLNGGSREGPGIHRLISELG
jgi:hypothetical protein